jgi:hypothetical protein
MAINKNKLIKYGIFGIILYTVYTYLFGGGLGGGAYAVVARGVNGTAWAKILSGGKWGGWTNIGGTFATYGGNMPTASLGGNIYAFGVGTDGVLYYQKYSASKWLGAWVKGSGTNIASVLEANTVGSVIKVAVKLGTTSEAWLATFNGTTMTWENLDGALN